MDVGSWLRSLGLGQYEAAFRDNEIDDGVLPKLTVDDLKDLGVAIVGHRRTIMSAIEALNAPSATRSEAATARPMQAPVPAGAPADAAERRQLTVMFCDLVGSTAMSARLDPEDMRELIRTYQDACSGAVARYDGFVAKFMGDGVLAYFGFPRAHEEDAGRAVRAGLDIVAVVAKLDTPAKQRLSVRIGVATGIVVVGDVVGHGSAQEQAVVGETPNLAARLQTLAEPGCVVIAESTRRLLGLTFELRPLGPQTLKGFDAPVPAWTVLGEAENVSRFEASRSQAMTPFVGREHEVALLLDRWRDACEGEGQAALLSGEAGIGKSRILAALRERIGHEPHVRVRYQCSPHHVNDAFYPIASHIWHAAGLVSGESAAGRLDKLEAMVARSGLEAQAIARFLAALLSIPGEGRYPPIEMAPADQKERTIVALMAVLEGLTDEAPVLALLEDAHWIDPTSLDVFSRLVDRLPSLRMLLVVTFRPEFVAPWAGGAHVASLPLSRFGRRQALAMVDGVAAGKALPAEVLDEIVAKTDGVPLFVEELTKSVLESGLLREEHGAYILDHALSPLAIPSTLRDSLMARLDRLAFVKEIAQIGAAIGREFSYRLLEEVSPIHGPALQDALGQLMTAELIHARGVPPEATYVFKHALVQDTAHASLLRSRRQRVHAEIARAMEERFPDQIEAAPSIIARHYTEAGLDERAARSWLAAAELALSRSANAEADRYVEVGLGLIPRLEDGPDRRSLELALLIARANALRPLKGFNAPELVAALSAAQQLLNSGVGTNSQRFSVLHGLCSARHVAAQAEPALALAREMVEVAGREDDTTFRLVGIRLLGAIQLLIGQNREALETLQRAECYREPGRQKLRSYRFGSDPGLNVLLYKIWALKFLGLLDQAERVGKQSWDDLGSQGHAQTVAGCVLWARVWPEFLSGDLEACERHAVELIDYCAEKKVEQFRLFGAVHRACARAIRQPTEENIAAIRTAIDESHRSGAHFMDSVYVSQLAEASLMAGDVTGAEASLQEGFSFVEQSGERFWLAELNRLNGWVALKQPEPDRVRAEDCFLKAIDIARSQEARILELRAATDLARLRRDMGSPNEPRALLEPILAEIEGGETAKDVRNARVLLAEMV